MKTRIIITAIAALFVTAFTASAQKFETFSGKTPEKVKQQYGTPVLEDAYSMSESYLLKYKDFSITFAQGSNYIEEFRTDNKKFIFLSSVLGGGVKVGDKVSKLSSIPLSKLKNKSGNKIKTPKFEVDLGDGNATKNATHVLFEEESERYYFYAENGVIKIILFETFEN